MGGSALFHATLLFHAQLLDELPMIYNMTIWWYCWFEVARPRPRPWLLPAFLAIDVLVTVGHAYFAFTTAFQTFFGMMVAVGVAFVFQALWRGGKSQYETKVFRFIACTYVGTI